MKFTRRLPLKSLDLLNLRQSAKDGGCRHCHADGCVKAHGYLYGYGEEGHALVTRGLRFFCSNRGSNMGCGRTFSTLWSHLTAHSSMSARQLLELVAAWSGCGAVHKAWTSTAVPVSLSTVARWIRRWKDSASHIRSHLFQIQAPPGDAAMSTSQFTLRYLKAAFARETCPAAAFQERFQHSFLL